MFNGKTDLKDIFNTEFEKRRKRASNKNSQRSYGHVKLEDIWLKHQVCIAYALKAMHSFV